MCLKVVFQNSSGKLAGQYFKGEKKACNFPARETVHLSAISLLSFSNALEVRCPPQAAKQQLIILINGLSPDLPDLLKASINSFCRKGGY